MLRKVKWLDLVSMRLAGRKVTAAGLYEAAQCRDGSEFVMCPDHPQGARPFRIWPEGVE